MRKINLSIKVKKTRKIIIEITNTEKRKIELKRQKLINTKDDMSHVYMELAHFLFYGRMDYLPSKKYVLGLILR